MKLTVERIQQDRSFTIGRLLVDGVFECWTLEDPCRTGPKVPGDTAIPFGTYKVTITMSNRFKRPMPLVHDVPGFTGIRIHSGNSAADTEGCLLVGDIRKSSTVMFSISAYNRVFAKIQAALAEGQEVSISYV